MEYVEDEGGYHGVWVPPQPEHPRHHPHQEHGEPGEGVGACGPVEEGIKESVVGGGHVVEDDGEALDIEENTQQRG